MTVTQPNMGNLTKEQLGYFVKGFVKKGIQVIDTNFYTQPRGLLAAFPVDNGLPSQTLELMTKTWAGGELDQPLDGAPESSRWKYVRSYKDLTNSWDKQGFFVFDSATTAAAANRLAQDGLAGIQNYFASVRVYKMIRELKSKNVSTHAADDVWGSAGTGDAEEDIAKAITNIVAATGVDPATTTFGCAYPSEVLDEFNQLDLINQVTQRLSDYLKGAWQLNFYPITPWKDGDGNAQISNRPVVDSDALGTSALVFAEGGQTMVGGEYRPGDIMLNETERVHATGYKTTFKQCVEYLAVPTTGTANGNSALIYEITAVTT